jgi:hypothetical protein
VLCVSRCKPCVLNTDNVVCVMMQAFNSATHGIFSAIDGPSQFSEEMRSHGLVISAARAIHVALSSGETPVTPTEWVRRSSEVPLANSVPDEFVMHASFYHRQYMSSNLLICLSVCQCFCGSACLSLCLSLCLSFYLAGCLCGHPCLSVFLLVCLFGHLCVG